MNKPNNRNQNEITKADYDFSDVISKSSKGELLACQIYEYARESRAVIEEITSMRSQIKLGEKCPAKSNPRVRTPMQGLKLLNLALTKGFPDLPWQILTEEGKLRLIEFSVNAPELSRVIAKRHYMSLLFDTDVAYQMLLGNPSNATADTNYHYHFLIQREVQALDSSDSLRHPRYRRQHPEYPRGSLRSLAELPHFGKSPANQHRLHLLHRLELERRYGVTRQGGWRPRFRDY